jgi:hypothetical protein
MSVKVYKYAVDCRIVSSLHANAKLFSYHAAIIIIFLDIPI